MDGGNEELEYDTDFFYGKIGLDDEVDPCVNMEQLFQDYGGENLTCRLVLELNGARLEATYSQNMTPFESFNTEFHPHYKPNVGRDILSYFASFIGIKTYNPNEIIKNTAKEIFNTVGITFDGDITDNNMLIDHLLTPEDVGYFLENADSIIKESNDDFDNYFYRGKASKTGANVTVDFNSNGSNIMKLHKLNASGQEVEKMKSEYELRGGVPELYITRKP